MSSLNREYELTLQLIETAMNAVALEKRRLVSIAESTSLPDEERFAALVGEVAW